MKKIALLLLSSILLLSCEKEGSSTENILVSSGENLNLVEKEIDVKEGLKGRWIYVGYYIDDVFYKNDCFKFDKTFEFDVNNGDYSRVFDEKDSCFKVVQTGNYRYVNNYYGIEKLFIMRFKGFISNGVQQYHEEHFVINAYFGDSMLIKQRGNYNKVQLYKRY